MHAGAGAICLTGADAGAGEVEAGSGFSEEIGALGKSVLGRVAAFGEDLAEAPVIPP